MAFPHMSLTPSQVEVLLAGPALPPPPGQVSNLDAPNPFYRYLVPSITTIQAVALIAVLMRLYTQFFLSDGLVCEDYLLILAWLFQLGDNIAGILCVEHGLGKHMWDITLRDFSQMSKAANYHCIMYLIAMIFIKSAIVLQFLRIFRIIKSFRIACWVCMAVNWCFYAAVTVAEIVECQPRERIWNPLVDGRCLDQRAIFEATAVFNLISDSIIFVLPLPILYRLQMDIRRKLGIMALFATGFLACAIGAARIYCTWLTFASIDVSRNLWGLGLLSCIESLPAILIFCMPTTPKFIHFAKAKGQGFLTNRSNMLIYQPSARPIALASITEEALYQDPQSPYPEATLESFAESAIRRLESTRMNPDFIAGSTRGSVKEKTSLSEDSWTDASHTA